MITMTRRNILRILGLAATSYAASTLPRPRIARGGGPAVPRRIVFFYTEQGTLHQYNPDGTLKQFWSPTAPGAPDPLSITKPWSTSSFTLGELHGPLAPYQNQLVLLDGIDMVSATVDPIGAADLHTNGNTHALIAANRQTSNLAGGISIDQYIANSINSPSPLTALPSLQMANTQFWNPVDNQSGLTPIYTGPGQPLTVPGVPQAVYNQMLPGGPMANPGAAAAALALAQQKSVLDYVQADYQNLASRLGTLDKQRVDAHAAAIRDLEQRLALPASSMCTEPDSSILASAKSGNDAASYNATAAVLLQLAQVALACDLTRVMTVYFAEAPPDAFGYQPIGGTTFFHELVHATNGSLSNGGPLMTDPTAMGMVKSFHTMNAGFFAQFLALLAGTQEADGSTLLDNTLVVWCGQLGGGDHSLDHLPYVLAGKMQGAVTPGRYVLYPRAANNTPPQLSQGPAHNDFFVTLANLMGVTTNTFGNPKVCTGPLPGVTA
jgi:hypothetical protein